MDKRETLRAVGAGITGATKENHQAVINAAQTIAAIYEAKAAGAIPLLAGDKDVLPALHAALGSALAAGRELHAAQFKTLQLAKRLALIAADTMVPTCECGSAMVEMRANLELAANGASIAA